MSFFEVKVPIKVSYDEVVKLLTEKYGMSAKLEFLLEYATWKVVDDTIRAYMNIHAMEPIHVEAMEYSINTNIKYYYMYKYMEHSDEPHEMFNLKTLTKGNLNYTSGRSFKGKICILNPKYANKSDYESLIKFEINP